MVPCLTGSELTAAAVAAMSSCSNHCLVWTVHGHLLSGHHESPRDGEMMLNDAGINFYLICHHHQIGTALSQAMVIGV